MTPKEASPQFLDTAGAAVFLGISASLLEKMRSGFVTDAGPKFSRVGRKCLYDIDVLKEYMGARLNGVQS